jgi:hypothetical protein
MFEVVLNLCWHHLIRSLYYILYGNNRNNMHEKIFLKIITEAVKVKVFES